MRVDLLSLLIPFAASLALAIINIKAGAEKKTKSINRFTIKTPRVYKILLLCISPLPVLIGLMLFLAFHNNADAETGVYIFLSAFSGIILLLLYIISILKLDVEGDCMVLRNIIGLHKKVSSFEVDKVVCGNHSIVIYAKGKRFGSLSKDCLHIENFLQYCASKKIPVKLNPQNSVAV